MFPGGVGAWKGRRLKGVPGSPSPSSERRCDILSIAVPPLDFLHGTMSTGWKIYIYIFLILPSRSWLTRNSAVLQHSTSFIWVWGVGCETCEFSGWRIFFLPPSKGTWGLTCWLWSSFVDPRSLRHNGD